MTPEGKVKKSIKDWLHAHKIYPAGSKVWKRYEMAKFAVGWYYMPVSRGMGTHGIHDFVMCIRGRFITIEAKAPGKAMNNNQEERQDEIEQVNGRVYLIDDAAQLETCGIKSWLT